MIFAKRNHGQVQALQPYGHILNACHLLSLLTFFYVYSIILNRKDVSDMTAAAIIISARDMNKKERKAYGKK
jgi:hypothetical protein